VDEAASRVRQEVDSDANIIVGATFDETLGDRVRVSIVASGMALLDENTAPAPSPSELRMRAAKAAAAAAVAGAPPPTPPPTPAPDDDMRRRLSEAIGYEHQGGTRPLPESHREPSSPTPPRDGWRAPGDVVIEEGFSHLNWLAQSAHTRAREGNVPSEPAQEFKPAPPTDIRRGARRMPEVEDFPPIMQREYRAKVGSGPAPATRAGGLVADGLSRLGILQRIMGRGRADEEYDSEVGADQEFDSVEHESLAPSEEEGWWEDDASAEDDPGTEHSSAVPATFNRLRK